MRKRILCAVIALVALQSLLFAQTKTSLNIQSNQVGARVFLNDNLAGYTTPNFSTLVNPGMYTLKVTKDGFPDFKTTVVVGQSPITVVANLGMPPAPSHSPPPMPLPKPQSDKHELTIEANVRGAQIYINGAFVGYTPFVSSYHPGTYSVSIRLNGYEEYSRSIKLSGSYRLFASLDPLPYPVYIDAANIPGASIYRDSVFIGTTPYRNAWMAGTYSVRISAPGYDDFVEKVFVSGPLTMQASLVFAYVDYEIRIPAFFATVRDNSLSFRDFAVYLDDRRIDSPYGRTTSGTHRLTMVFNDLRFETSFNLPQGKLLVIEPFLGVHIQ
jgi:hypothetical protein